MGTLARHTLTDDSGDGASGSIINNAFIQQVYDDIDSEVKSATNPTITTKAAIDAVSGGNAGQVFKSNGGGLGSWGAGTCALLTSGSGTDTSAAATVVASYLMGSTAPLLGALDTVVVHFSLASVTQATAGAQLYNSTDTLALANCNTGSIAAGTKLFGTQLIRQFQSGATAVAAQTPAYLDSLGGTQGPFANYVTFTTNWTGAWTLGLRHTGVTAGGTFQWSWSVFVLRG